MKFEDFPDDARKAAIESYQNAIKDISPVDKTAEEMQKRQLESLAKNIVHGFSALLEFSDHKRPLELNDDFMKCEKKRQELMSRVYAERASSHAHESAALVYVVRPYYCQSHS
ncbi:hypothetical protein AB7V82_14530 [Providencia stuartii]|uniref:hypothetical protein n=1 Tax=Providencia TaxID=586 RepID=UPI0034D585B7